MPEDSPFYIYPDTPAGRSNSIVKYFGAKSEITSVFHTFSIFKINR